MGLDSQKLGVTLAVLQSDTWFLVSGTPRRGQKGGQRVQNVARRVTKGLSGKSKRGANLGSYRSLWRFFEVTGGLWSPGPPGDAKRVAREFKTWPGFGTRLTLIRATEGKLIDR